MPDFDVIVTGDRMRRPSPGGSYPGGRKRISVNVGDGACAAQIGTAPASQIRHTATGAQRSVLVLASSIVVAFLAAANAPSPLYERYETAWHASPLIGTIAFAAYAVAVIAGLSGRKSCPRCSDGERCCSARSPVRSSHWRCSRSQARSRSSWPAGCCRAWRPARLLGRCRRRWWSPTRSAAPPPAPPRRVPAAGRGPCSGAGRAVSARPAADHRSHPRCDPGNPGALRAACHSARTAPPAVVEGGEPTGGGARTRRRPS